MALIIREEEFGIRVVAWKSESMLIAVSGSDSIKTNLCLIAFGPTRNQ